MGIGFLSGNELGVGKPETPGPPLVVMLRDVLHDHLRRTIPNPFAFDIWIEAEGAVIRAAALGLHADRFLLIRAILRENGGQVGQVHRQRIEECRGTLLALLDLFPSRMM